MAKIIWSEIDEAPALATYAFLPIVKAFCKGTGVDVETTDISLSGRILANFPENLTEEQKVADNLSFSQKGMTSPAILKKRPPTQKKSCKPVTLNALALLSTRCCVKATLTVVQLRRLKNSPRKTRTA